MGRNENGKFFPSRFRFRYAEPPKRSGIESDRHWNPARILSPGKDPSQMETPADIPVQIRPARESDTEELERFIQPFVDEEKLLPRTAYELELLEINGFVAERDGKIVGFCALEIYSPKLAEIRSLAVAAEAQGTGLGTRLVAACVARAKERQILEVMAISSSENFFRSCGFDFTLPGEKKAFFLQTREEE